MGRKRRNPMAKGLAVLVALAIVLATFSGYAVSGGKAGLWVAGNVGPAVPPAVSIQIFSGDGVTPLPSGDTVEFGTVQTDYWGTAAVPLQKLYVTNTSSSQQRVVVTGDMRDNAVPVFGSSTGDLREAPGNAFILEPQGVTGDTLIGWLGLDFVKPTTGSKSTTIIFEATTVGGGSLLNAIDFEDSTLGQLCLFEDAHPLRDKYLQSHGVTFRGDAPDSLDGLAVLHECSNLGTSSHSTGDYFLAGINGFPLKNGGNPFLPEVISFVHPVSEVSFYGCSCGSSFSYTLAVHGYGGPEGTGTELAADSRATTRQWQVWKVTAPDGAAFRSVVLRGNPNSPSIHVIVDDLQWIWVE